MPPAAWPRYFLKKERQQVWTVCLSVFHIPFSLHQIIDTLSTIFEKTHSLFSILYLEHLTLVTPDVWGFHLLKRSVIL